MSKKPLQIVDRAVPLYRRRVPTPRKSEDFRDVSHIDYIDLSKIHLPPFGASVSDAAGLFDDRAAATVCAGINDGVVVLGPTLGQGQIDLLQEQYSGKDKVLLPTARCLAVMAYFTDYFPNEKLLPDLRPKVFEAILKSSPGYCGTFGPGVDNTIEVLISHQSEGNYDMGQMSLLQIAYRYYNELPRDAQDHLVEVLLATGRIHRPNKGDLVTSGGAPGDYSEAGSIDIPGFDMIGIHEKLKGIGETENHILSIHTARYLTNQLLYQRDHNREHDNRNNGSKDSSTSCTDLMLRLLRNILRDDFSEYNSKNYQNETRYALLNLYNYSYDYEVRLAAQMVLDYISAHIAVSSNDLRRIVPFRRRNQEPHITNTNGFMTVGLVETIDGADPMVQHFAILAGNTRTYETSSSTLDNEHVSLRPNNWSIATNGENGVEALADALSEYRLPSLIHDLFINDMHRRFFQRLHRTSQDDTKVTGRNCDNFEIYASSPSYLITAGGSPSTYAIDPHFLGIVWNDQDQQKGVAVTTSFMPTGTSAGNPNPQMAHNLQNNAKNIIQFSSFSDEAGKAFNYGVAPDFACGHTVGIPDWCKDPINGNNDRMGNFRFVNSGRKDNVLNLSQEFMDWDQGKGPGFFLSIYTQGDIAVIEAWDNWLHPHILTFDQFKKNVIDKNGNLHVENDVEAEYTTQNGNHLKFIIWKNDSGFGARINKITYGNLDTMDAIGDAGNVKDKFLNGTVLNSIDDGIIEITNHFLGTKITLDMKDQWNPRRTSETGEVEEAGFGFHNEIWVDFNWNGENKGDFFHPFKTIADAVAVVANGGVIKIMPGFTTERPFLSKTKKIKLVAPAGGVTIGVS
jgi:hypothetical protein